MSEIIRCAWVSDDPQYIAYHDNEWGRVCKDSQQLFERVCLEGQQAGLSWILVLKKRENYRQLFYDFDPVKIVKMSDEQLAELATNPLLIRNLKKITSIRNNAHAYLKMQAQGIDFAEFLWGFVGGESRKNHFKTHAEIPTKTAESVAMSKALKQHGFSFVGPVSCYALMQATGMVDDHLVGCVSRVC